MNWVLLIAAGWPLLAIVVGLIIGRVLQLRNERG